MEKMRPVVHFEIRGRDGAGLQKFYAELFNWKIDSNNPLNYGLVTPGEGGPEEGVGGGITSADAPLVTVFVQVANLSETLAKVESMGGKTVQAPTDVPGGPTLAQFSDPEGNVIGIVQQ